MTNPTLSFKACLSSNGYTKQGAYLKQTSNCSLFSPTKWWQFFCVCPVQWERVNHTLKVYRLSGGTQVLSYILSARFLIATKLLRQKYQVSSSSRTVMFSMNDYWNLTNVFLSLLYVDIGSPTEFVSNIRFIIIFISGERKFNIRFLQ